MYNQNGIKKDSESFKERDEQAQIYGSCCCSSEVLIRFWIDKKELHFMVSCLLFMRFCHFYVVFFGVADCGNSICVVLCDRV